VNLHVTSIHRIEVGTPGNLRQLPKACRHSHPAVPNLKNPGTETMIRGRKDDNSQTRFPLPQTRNKQEEMIEFEEKQ